jgi:putative methionine-R-sulfoxide reductase with GAF domain
MTRPMRYSVLPKELIKELRLEGPLREIYSILGPGQAFIQFIRSFDDEFVYFEALDEKLWIHDNQLRVGIIHSDDRPIGLTRYVATQNRTEFYPDGDGAPHYAEIDSRVKAEIVGPIHYQNGLTGVVLIDCIHERHYSAKDVALFESFCRSIDRQIEAIARKSHESYVGEQLQEIINDCYRNTLTKRGYIAVKRWDGRLEYFTVGDEKELFLELAPHEGLCGQVLRTGKLENPETPLLGEGNYIPSDDAIQSEIVCPIKNELGTTIGVINLESYLAEAYDLETEKLLRVAADRAAEHAGIYTKPPDPDFGFAITDLFQFSLWVRPPESPDAHEEEIRGSLERWAKGLLKGKQCEFWLGKHHSAPPLLQDRSWEEAVKGGEVQGEGKVIVYAPVLLSGDPRFVIAVERDFHDKLQDLNTHDKFQDLNTLKALCRIASEAFRRSRYEYRMRSYIDLISYLIAPSNYEVALDRAVQAIPYILQSDHCTLFYPFPHRGKKLFVAGPSTSEVIHVRGKNPGYLPEVSEGLTGFVAHKGQSLRIRNVRDSEELRQLDPDLSWESRISEEVERECRSLLASPIFALADSREVIGVLRTHRDERSHRSGFSDEDFKMFESIAHAIRDPLTKFLNHKIQVSL